MTSQYLNGFSFKIKLLQSVTVEDKKIGRSSVAIMNEAKNIVIKKPSRLSNGAYKATPITKYLQKGPQVFSRY